MTDSRDIQAELDAANVAIDGYERERAEVDAGGWCGHENPLGEMLRADELQRKLDRTLAERDAALARLGRVEVRCKDSETGEIYEHDGHGPSDGYPECPGCWSRDVLRAALPEGGGE